MKPIPFRHKAYLTRPRYKLIPIIQQFIKAADNGEILTRKAVKYSKKTLRVYGVTAKKLKEYEAFTNTTIYIDDVSSEWASYFISFCYSQGLAKNSIGRMIANIKAVMTRAFKMRLTDQSGYDIPTLKEYTHQVFTDLDDLKALANFSEYTEAEIYVRDLYFIQTFLGLRIADFRRFLKNPKKYIINHENYDFVRLHNEKTNNKTVIPFSVIVRRLLEKYNYQFRKVSSQHYNKYLKIIAKI